ncbi:MAG: hypothetical protein ACW99R_14775, partial [Candidatus Hodarchaeales archaeon]
MAQTYEERVVSSVTLNKLFIDDFIEFYTNIKRINIKKTCEIIKVCEDVFNTYTKPFYEKWSQLEFLKWNKGYIQHFYSFVLVCKGIKILIPHRLIGFELINPANTLLDQFTKVESLNDFFDILSTILHHLNLPLLKNDVRILQTFQNPALRKKIMAVPTNRQLGNITQISENTISRRLDQLYQKIVLSHIYRIAMAKLGYQTISVTHLDQNPPTPPEIDDCCLMDMPIDLGNKIGKIKVFQIHHSNNCDWQKLIDYIQPQNSTILTRSYIG